jgi:hypothetical protein
MGTKILLPRKPSLRKRYCFTLLSAALTFALSLIASEMLLWVLGKGECRVGVLDRALFEHEPVLGWRSKEGRFIVPAYSTGVPDIRVTNLPDGQRATHSEGVGPGRRVVALVLKQA